MEMVMLYKTIVLELLKDRPEIHEKLCQKQMLLRAMEYYARKLKELHEAWKQHLSQTSRNADQSQIASQAMELALHDLEDILPSASSSEAADRPSLDDFLNFLLEQHTPPA
jgi:hypothetical protein